MSNYVMLIGRIVNESKIDIDTKTSEITLAISRSYRNEEGIYDTDFIPVKLTGNIAKSTIEYCRKGDLIAIRGTITRTNEFEPMRIIADKIIFLACKN